MDVLRLMPLAVSFLLLLAVRHLSGALTANATDFEAYGVKVAMNENLLVQARNGDTPPAFLVQFSPYNDTQGVSRTSIPYPDGRNNFVFTVAVGKKQARATKQFFFAGELTNGLNGTFIGLAKSNDTLTTLNTRFFYSVQYFYSRPHEEYFVLGVEPTGRYAYGLSNKFISLVDSQNPLAVQSWNATSIWPDASFMPHSIDIGSYFAVVSGFVQNVKNALTQFVPVIYLMNFNASNQQPIVVDQYKPLPTPGTWQDLLTNWDADTFSAMYDMSVSINDNGGVLVGMQFINRVFLLAVNNTRPTTLVFVSRSTNGRSLGNGKSVAWLDNGIAAILVNSYSLNYQWSLSQVYFYDIQNSGYNSSTTPLSVFPSNFQILPSRMSSVFLHVVSSPSSMALQDDQGDLIIFTPTQPGFYPSIVNRGSVPLFTSSQACLPGTSKSQSGLHSCQLCPTGTKNSGNASVACAPCLSSSFCPLGSVNDMPISVLQSTGQIIAYPKSPESTIFDEILIQNMFHLGSNHCLLVSPLFWTMIVAGIALIIVALMAILKLCIIHPRSHRLREVLKRIFKRTDLIGEGELWIGGLASFCVVVLVSFAYAFSINYYKQYPIETAADANFVCDPALRNAKFQTSTRSLAIPPTHAEQKMFDLLSNQGFNLNIDFLNTLINCDAASLLALFGTKWTSIRWSNCSNANSILSLSIPLAYQHLSVQVLLDDVKTIGGLRLGLSGDPHEEEFNTLKQLNFTQSFSKAGQVLAQSLPVNLAMTKVINETAPLKGEESDFTGIYIPTFSVDINSLFLTNDQYVRSALTSTTLTVVLTETPYYVKNIQEPIAKSSEIIFHNLLFTVVCLELFGLFFLLYKLIIKPIHNYIFRRYEAKHRKSSSAKARDAPISVLPKSSSGSETETGGTDWNRNRNRPDSKETETGTE